MIKKIAIIIPCYNEEAVITIFYNELIKYINYDYQFMLIFVDDGSKDRTLDLIKNFIKNDERIKFISFSRNFGKEAAMLAGLRAAKALQSDAAIIIDADLQHPPSLIPKMLQYYEDGYQHIYTKIKSRQGEPFFKIILVRIFYKIYKLLTGDNNLVPNSCDCSLLEKKVIDAFLEINDHYRFTKGIFSWIGFEKKCIEFTYNFRKAGKTTWSLKKLFNYAMNGIHQFSHLYMLIPSLAIIIGFGITLYDLIIALFISYNQYLIRIDLGLILILVCLRFIMKLLYHIRDQNLKRPTYITKSSNLEVFNEIDSK